MNNTCRQQAEQMYKNCIIFLFFLEKRGNERQVKTLTLFNSFQYRQAAAYLNISNISNMHRRLFTFYAIVLYIFSLIVYLWAFNSFLWSACPFFARLR